MKALFPAMIEASAAQRQMADPALRQTGQNGGPGIIIHKNACGIRTFGRRKRLLLEPEIKKVPCDVTAAGQIFSIVGFGVIDSHHGLALHERELMRRADDAQAAIWKRMRSGRPVAWQRYLDRWVGGFNIFL